MELRLPGISLLVALSAACRPGAISLDRDLDTGESSAGETSATTGSASATATRASTTEAGTEPDTTGTDDPELIPCDPYAPVCGPGQKCGYVEEFGESLCVAVTGEGMIGEVCDYFGTIAELDSCGADSVCVAGLCAPHCEGSFDDPICTPGLSCFAHTSHVVCVTTCLPLLQDCVGEAGCFWDELVGGVCAASGGRELHEPCAAFNDCAPGLYCAPADLLPSCEGDACCTSFCDIQAPDCSAVPGTQCELFHEDYWGQYPLGLCVEAGSLP